MPVRSSGRPRDWSLSDQLINGSIEVMAEKVTCLTRYILVGTFVHGTNIEASWSKHRSGSKDLRVP